MFAKNKENQHSRINTNRSGKHPSYESTYSQSRPSIKIGYKVSQTQRTSDSRKMKKKVHSVQSQSFLKGQGKKKINNMQQQSGNFVECQYIKRSDSRDNFVYHKKGVNEAHQKYHSGKEVEKHLKSNFNSRRTHSSSNQQRQQKVLPSYQNIGIKDVLEYHHAKPYRDVQVAKKCTEQTAISKYCKFNELHDYDFRKRNDYLR